MDRLADQLQPFSRLREKSLPPRRRGWREATDEGAFRKAAPSPHPLSRFAGEGLKTRPKRTTCPRSKTYTPPSPTAKSSMASRTEENRVGKWCARNCQYRLARVH